MFVLQYLALLVISTSVCAYPLDSTDMVVPVLSPPDAGTESDVEEQEPAPVTEDKEAASQESEPSPSDNEDFSVPRPRPAEDEESAPTSENEEDFSVPRPRPAEDEEPASTSENEEDFSVPRPRPAEDEEPAPTSENESEPSPSNNDEDVPEGSPRAAEGGDDTDVDQSHLPFLQRLGIEQFDFGNERFEGKDKSDKEKDAGVVIQPRIGHDDDDDTVTVTAASCDDLLRDCKEKHDLLSCQAYNENCGDGDDSQAGNYVNWPRSIVNGEETEAPHLD